MRSSLRVSPHITALPKPSAAAQAPLHPGRALPPPVRRKMENVLHHNLAAVRIHEDSRPESIGAIAYARGNHVHFALGRYQPDTRGGQELLAHELTHVVQQRTGRAATASGGVEINADPLLEGEADRAAGSIAAASARAPHQSAGAPTAGAEGPAITPPVIQPMRRVGTAVARSRPSMMTRAYSGGAGGGGGDDPRRHMRALEEMKKAERQATVSPEEKIKRMTAFYKKMYPVMAPGTPGAHDPLLRDHIVGKFSEVLKTLPRPQLEAARKTREHYTQSSAEPDPDAPLPVQAANAYQARQDRRLQARRDETSPEALELIEHAERLGFGEPSGETIEQMMRRQILRHGDVDEGLRAIVGSSGRANRQVQAAVGLGTENPRDTQNAETLRRLQQHFPEYFQGPGASMEIPLAIGGDVRALAAEHFASPEQRRGRPSPGRERIMEAMLARMRRRLAGLKKAKPDEKKE